MRKHSCAWGSSGGLACGPAPEYGNQGPDNQGRRLFMLPSARKNQVEDVQ